MSEPRIKQSGERALIAFDGDLTSSTVLDVRPRLTEMLEHGVRDIVFDFAGTGMVDSSGLGMLMSAHNRLVKLGGRLRVVGASDEILALFRAMRLDKRFLVTGRVEEAGR